MSELYLILHRVRGEPAFDIATPLQIGNEEGWVIPTSGHRAYPYWSCALRDINWQNKTVWEANEENERPAPCPDDWPDHYSTSSPRSAEAVTTDLLSTLGLTAPPKTFLRR